MTPIQFKTACKKHGIYIDRCGMSVRDLLTKLRCAPISSEKSKAGTKMPHHSAMGIAIMAGLIHYLPKETNYVIAPAGETWLTELEIHGLSQVNTEDQAAARKKGTNL